MSAQTISERRLARRHELVEAAMRVIRRGGPSASMDDIAAEAGITKPILYRHFGDKAGLGLAVAQRCLGEVMGDLTRAMVDIPPGPEMLAAAMGSYLAFIERDPEIYRFLSEQPDELEERKNLGRGFADAITANLLGFGFDPEACDIWGHGLVGMVEAVGHWRLGTGPVRAADTAHHLATLLWEGFAALGTKVMQQQQGGEAS